MTDDTTPKAVRRDPSELLAVEAIAASGADRPVLMLNLNRYTAAAGYPDGAGYKAYMKAMAKLLPQVGAKSLWQTPAHGQIVGEQAIHEILAIWYPSHQAFIDMKQAPDAPENYKLRAAVVEYAVIHRCDGETAPLAG